MTYDTGEGFHCSLLTRWAPVLQRNNSEAAHYCILQQSGWWKVFIFPAVIISSPTSCFFPPTDSRHCGLPRDCKSWHSMVQLINVIFFLWGNSLQAWTRPWWGRGNDNDHHLSSESSSVRGVCGQIRCNIWVHTPAGWTPGVNTSLQLLRLKWISLTANGEQRTPNLACWPDSQQPLSVF